MTQVIAHATRDADLAAPDQSLKPGSYVHPIAKDVAILDHDVTDVDPDSKAHPRRFRLGVVRLFERLLDLNGAANRVEDAREFGKNAITGCGKSKAASPES
jgi:hypothetical protein